MKTKLKLKAKQEIVIHPKNECIKFILDNYLRLIFNLINIGYFETN